jgi:hypothetical protein
MRSVSPLAQRCDLARSERTAFILRPAFAAEAASVRAPEARPLPDLLRLSIVLNLAFAAAVVYDARVDLARTRTHPCPSEAHHPWALPTAKLPVRSTLDRDD